MTSRPLEFGDPRLLQDDELAAAERLSRLCFGGAEDESPDEESPATFARPRRGSSYIIAHQGKPVSLISTYHYQIRLSDGFIRVGSIGGVCTHPKFRELGLAGRLLEHCTHQLAQEGARLILISGERGLYTRVGCVQAGIFHSFTIRPGQSGPAKPSLVIRPATRSDLSLLSQIYQAEPVHFVRQVSYFTERLRHPGSYIHAEQWIAEISGRPAAYLLLGIPWEYLDRPEGGIRHVREYAGSHFALAGALDLIRTQQNIHKLHWPVAWQDIDLSELLQERGYKATLAPLSEHTMRIINFPGLMTDLRPYVRARLEANLQRGLRFEQAGPLLGATCEDRYIIARGRDRLELDGAAMTRLVLGAPGATNPPTLHAPGALGEVVSALFPLPSFMPGLNYQ